MRASPYLICAFASAVAVSACGSEASCPSGSVKNKKGICESRAASEASMDGGPTSTDDDAATDEERDASMEDDACVKGEETCNGLDDDCDGNVDEDLTGDSFIDRDKDGYGTGDAVQGCGGAGYASKDGDCDDGNDARSPGAAEACNGVDDNCDGVVDEGVRVTLYLDEDGDGHGLSTDSDVYCAGQVVPNRVPSSADCDDKCPTCSPDNTQETLCDGKDDDCDGELDEGVNQLFEADCDKDGFAAEKAELARACVSPATGPKACAQGGWTAPGGLRDCNDGRADLNPSAAEVCDYIDNNCNSVIDEIPGQTGAGGQRITWSLDCDGDGYLLSTPDVITGKCPNDVPAVPADCTPLSGVWRRPGEATAGVDCADGDANAFPGSTYSSRDPIAWDSSVTTPYDYNCSGADQPSGSVCAAGIRVCLSPKSCWEGAVPACGGTGQLWSCSLNVLTGNYVSSTAPNQPSCR